MARNTLVIVGAVIVGLMVIQLFMMAERYVTEGRVFEGVAGAWLLQFITLAPRLATAGAIGAISAFGLKTSRPKVWAVAVSGTVAALFLLGQRYVSPDWLAWFSTFLIVLAPAA